MARRSNLKSYALVSIITIIMVTLWYSSSPSPTENGTRRKTSLKEKLELKGFSGKVIPKKSKPKAIPGVGPAPKVVDPRVAGGVYKKPTPVEVINAVVPDLKVVKVGNGGHTHEIGDDVENEDQEDQDDEEREESEDEEGDSSIEADDLPSAEAIKNVKDKARKPPTFKVIPGAPRRTDPPPSNQVGWSQRFKKPIAIAPVPVEKKVEPVTGILAHSLVAQLARREFTTSLPISTNDESDTFQAQPSATTTSSPPLNVNLTLCALIPGESRFLQEWLIFHRLLGVERFALYDTNAPGAAGAAEIDHSADSMHPKGGEGGEGGSNVDEIKSNLGSVTTVLDDSRFKGLEKWMIDGLVELHWMKYKGKASFHEDMMNHCVSTYSPRSQWLAHLDVDEYLHATTSLYESATAEPVEDSSNGVWTYPFIAKLYQLKEAACLPIPSLNFRNFGVRTLEAAVTTVQKHRDALNHRKILPTKAILHSNFSTDSPTVLFSGPHSCAINPATTDGTDKLNDLIMNSQAELLQTGGIYDDQKRQLPIEPIFIAHYSQRDLTDCQQKISSLNDPNSVLPKSKGSVLCEEQYLPSPSELATPSFVSSPQNRFLAKLVTGSVVIDSRLSDSFTGEATKLILESWEKEGVMETTKDDIEKARKLVKVLSF